MGTRLMIAVDDHWRHLGDREFRTLMRMARVALDRDSPTTQAALYYAAREDLARALGLAWPDGDEETAVRQRTSSSELVRRSIRALRKAHAIELIARADGTRPARYRLTLGPP